MSKKDPKPKTGPKPERVKIEDGWKDAVNTALKKKRPPKGWPTSAKIKKG